ncbi:hypothetical protein GQ42DRAFT_160859 [Ramicandelaber brevisporus]|nr:hypothetical protein GQ42DRAFT_160859 [Ramicandelaber brevisporus]
MRAASTALAALSRRTAAIATLSQHTRLLHVSRPSFKSATKTTTATIEYYTSSTCGLCDEAKHKLGIVLAKAKESNGDFAVNEIDIHTPENKEKGIGQEYVFDIPVATVNGKLLFQHRIKDEEATLAKLLELAKQ